MQFISFLDDEFPDIADLLRGYPRPRQNADISVTTSNAPIVLPRPSLRSSTFDGKTIFLKRKSHVIGASRASAPEKFTGNLLGTPIHRLMDELSATAVRRLIHLDTDPSASTSRTEAKKEDTLWVDRYRPKRFTDLLGDERVHREVLAWVKQWDFCVFGKGKGKKRARNGERFTSSEDELCRPQEKILLLSGPPGLGKTTLAHVVASQAGYDVFEINASDARSGQVVDERIRPALESGYAVGSSKPVLVVIDEIDGATGDNAHGFINKLIQLTYEKANKTKGKRKSDQGKQALRRPIICICNDLYASSLTKLRSLARIIRFTRPADIHIVKRLRDICDAEGLRTDSRALSTLVGIALGDLRGCLNTLQFIKVRSRDVTEHLIRRAAAGLKEADANYFNILTDLFCPMSKKRVKERGLGEADENKYVERLSHALDASGTLDRVALGCFEHYGNLRQHDATFARYKKANEWLVAYDVLSGSMRAEREYGLLPYLSYTLVPFFPLFQERGGPRVERPKADWEWHVKTRANEEVYKSLARAVRTGNARSAGHFRDLMSEPVLILEFAPLLNRIIAPPIRPVNSQVIRPEEKAMLARLVNIMVSLELRFVHERSEDGQLLYKLDPPVDSFVTYDGKRAVDIPPPRYAVRHLVATEIDAQLAVRHAEAIERTKATKPSTILSSAKETRDADENDPSREEGRGLFESPPITDEPPRKRNKTTAADVDVFEKPAVDFFGRPIMTPKSDGIKSASSRNPATPAYRVSFRFKEGNSAAVRKPVRMASFL
ncbi:P-loop containing nucleoside triphosphate hydrolase protein [Russula earlei]|uniref:P-loop containing nucleoside triphosphate hydrolase protein n=1 Tax=Russula earlei TaxID=71964 RepID=A0ACC0U368_9AGAM|nr:P-loop containing nucleoside triphosphate hydrolase protein [Russula earlei]